MIKISISVSAHRFMVDGVFLTFVMHRKVALVKCSLKLFSHLAFCHCRRAIKVSLKTLYLQWVLVLESCETGGCALAVWSQRASEHFIPSQTLPHAGLRGGRKCLTPVSACVWDGPKLLTLIFFSGHRHYKLKLIMWPSNSYPECIYNGSTKTVCQITCTKHL